MRRSVQRSWAGFVALGLEIGDVLGVRGRSAAKTRSSIGAPAARSASYLVGLLVISTIERGPERLDHARGDRVVRADRRRSLSGGSPRTVVESRRLGARRRGFCSSSRSRAPPDAYRARSPAPRGLDLIERGLELLAAVAPPRNRNTSPVTHSEWTRQSTRSAPSISPLISATCSPSSRPSSNPTIVNSPCFVGIRAPRDPRARAPLHSPPRRTPAHQTPIAPSPAFPSSPPRDRGAPRSLPYAHANLDTPGRRRRLERSSRARQASIGCARGRNRVRAKRARGRARLGEPRAPRRESRSASLFRGARC